MTYDGFLRLLPVYGFTIFLNAALLFWVEPLSSRMILPIRGGGPAIWNTGMVFVQAMVLLGYLVLLERLFHRRLAQLAVLLMAVTLMRPHRDAIFHECTFFGVPEVQASLSASGPIHYLYHGTTIHGMTREALQKWQPLPAQPGRAVWTDDYANVIRARKSGLSQ